MFLVLACAGITASADAAQTAAVRPTVKPGTGNSRTRFVVGFRAPQNTGQTGSTRVQYAVGASLRSHPKGCVSSISATVDHADAGSLVDVKLNPKSAGGRWCSGRFHGKIEEFVSTVCVGCPGPLGVLCAELACPASSILPAPDTIGKFAFRVRK